MHQSGNNGGLAADHVRDDLAAERPVAIVGMHRSGTSMVAKLLMNAGLVLGPEEDLMPPAEENPEGFFEHLDIVRLNDEVLNAAGAGWDCPPPAGFDWTGPEFDVYRDRAQHLAAKLSGDGRWGWKDPRSSLTLPFWRSALGPLQTIAVVRNPLEVVTSLHRRNGFSIALSLTLWQIYGERILGDTTPADRVVTHYDAYFLEPEREISRILDFIGLESREALTSLQATTLPRLRHHRKTARDLEAHGFSSEITDLYRRLCREAEWWEGGAETVDPADPQFFMSKASADTISRGAGEVDLIRVENVALRRNNADFTAALTDRETRITELETALLGHETMRTELDGKIAERDGKVRERNALLQVRDQAISALQQERAEREAELIHIRVQAAQLSGQLSESERGRTVAELHERELRAMLTGLQQVQLQRDAEIMGTLGAVLSRHAPGAPASIYHRKLVDQIRHLVDAHVPAEARVLVATYGDPAMLKLGSRLTEPFPRSAPGVSADYTDVSEDVAVAQLEALREAGAEYLVVPGPALPWLANHPALDRHLDRHYSVVARERGVLTIYAFNRQQGQIPA